jgi:peptidoglycan LD-endopeptidase LytH
MKPLDESSESRAGWLPLDEKHLGLPSPVLGDALRGEAHLFRFSGAGAMRYAVDDHRRFARQIEEELRAANRSWGIGAYLENRSILLRDYPQMISEKRVYHAGVDLMAPTGTRVHAPLAGVIDAHGFDAGLGNYGAYLRLRHEVAERHFYSFYGHLDGASRRQIGEAVEAGEIIAELGQGEDAGGWFPHLHLQILSPRAVEEGMTLVGYIAEAMLDEVDRYFPSPWPLIRT